MLRSLVILSALALSTAHAGAADILQRLAEPRTHAVMRHALAPGSGDPNAFDLNHCETQRNLSNDGRRQAGRAGDMVRAAGVTIDHLWTSQYCRCRETAEIMAVGEVVDKPFLNSFIRDSHRRVERMRRLREALAALPDQETAFLVTHNVNAEELTGTRPVSGEIQVIRLEEDGSVTILGSVRPNTF
ncbi:MAG: histidine phosphatase family protein [Pseudomonadota bacterium]